MSAMTDGKTHTQTPGALRMLTNEDFAALEPLVWRGRTLEDGVKMVIIAVRELLMMDAPAALATGSAAGVGEVVEGRAIPPLLFVRIDPSGAPTFTHTDAGSVSQLSTYAQSQVVRYVPESALAAARGEEREKCVQIARACVREEERMFNDENGGVLNGVLAARRIVVALAPGGPDA